MTELREASMNSPVGFLRMIGMNESHIRRGVLRTGDKEGPTYLSAHPDFKSDVEPYFFSLESVDDAKKLGGIPDVKYKNGIMEEHYDIPLPLSGDKMTAGAKGLSGKELRNVHKAFEAYVFGNSAKVNGYKDLINDVHFPYQIAAFAVEDVVVDKDHPLIITSKDGQPVVASFRNVTIKPGGQIECHADCKLQMQKLTQESEPSAVKNFVSIGADGGAGSDGGNSIDAGKGDKGENAENRSCGKCAKHPGKGGQGRNAQAGGNGGNGGNGQRGSKMAVDITDTISGEFNIGSVGGNGGRGGNGGNGGKGGVGGDGGDGSSHCGGPGEQGKGGNGGDGGKAGDGGDGGAGDNVYLTFVKMDPNTKFNILKNQGIAGTSGIPGKEGSGGVGVGDGDNGKPGGLGKNGINGAIGTVYINGKVIG